MHLLGLPLAQLATIFGVAGAVVVGLYILKLRRRPVPVPFAPLWSRILRDKEATSLFSRLKRLLSLLLQLALLTLLVLSLGDPRTAREVVKGRSLVVLVDTSASMQAANGGPDKSRPRIELAKDELRKLVRGLGASDRMLIASMDAVVTPLSPMTGDSGPLEAAIDAVHAADCRADLSRGLRFATDSLRGAKEPEAVIISDGNLGEARDSLGMVKLGDVKLSFVPVGDGKRNVAITQFSVRRYPLDKARYEVMIEVQNLADHDENIELSLFGDDVLVDLTKLHMKAGERLPRFYPNLGGASRTLEARIAVTTEGLPKHDDLAADDRAYAVLPERRRTKVLAVSTGNTYLEAALLLDEYLDVTTVTPDKMSTALAEGRFDVAIYDGIAPALRPGLPALYLDPHDSTGPVKVETKILKEPNFDTLERKHPILRWTALDNVGIASATKLTPQSGDRVVGASSEGPLIIAGSRSTTKFVVLAFDVRQSDFPLRIAWPVFLLNSINWFVEEDAEYLSSFKTGDVWHVPAPLGATRDAMLVEPGGATHRVPIQEGRAVFFGTKAGFYHLKTDANVASERAGDTGARHTDVVFAANIADPVESAITPKQVLVVDGKAGGPVSGFTVGVRRELWIYLLAIAALVTALEWVTYHRRITV